MKSASKKQKTKTKHAENLVKQAQYQRKPDELLSKNQSLPFARALIMGRYGMLDCANNYSMKYGGKNCRNCGVLDDETHRINHCKLYENINRFNSSEKVIFDDIYSNDHNLGRQIVSIVMSMWDLESGKNEMRTLP